MSVVVMTWMLKHNLLSQMEITGELGNIINLQADHQVGRFFLKISLYAL